MPILIDCYNVLHAEKPPALAGLGEASLCALMARGPWARAGVTVVCDGSPKPHSPDPREVEPVELIFSGPGRSADDVIIRLIDEDTAPRRLTVVSSDRTIRRAARRRRARDWSSESFLVRLAQAARGGRQGGGATAPGKPATGPLPDDHVERWLDYFGVEADGAVDKPVEDPWADLEGLEDLDDLDDLERG
jgi:hypothetical protein